MSTEILKININEDASINKVNVDTLKNKIIARKKKQKLQSRIIFGSILVSIGLIGYFVD